MKKSVWLVVPVLSLVVSGCKQVNEEKALNGYVEAVEFYVSAPQAGWITALSATEGSQVKAGEVLTQLDDDAQRIAVAQAQAQFESSAQQLQDLQQGARQQELAVSQKALDAQTARVEEARLAFQRQKQMLSDKVTSQSLYDQAKAAYDVAQAQLQQTQEQLAVLHLPAREHAIAAAKHNRDAAQQAVELQQWNLEQRRILARNSGTVEQVFYRQGEFVNQGVPILSLIMPQTMKVRFYLPQSQLSEIKMGQTVQIHSDSSQDTSAQISYIAKQPEFTPPVLYSNESRDKLVFLVEATMEQGRGLRPGQPVDITL